MDKEQEFYEADISPIQLDNGEIITCVSISGSKWEMPEWLTLKRELPNGGEIYARYVQDDAWRSKGR